MRLLRLGAAPTPAVATGDQACIAGPVSGFFNITAICNVPYDTVNPSEQTYARTIGAIFYPTNLAGGASNASAPIVLFGSGKAWRGDFGIPFTRFLRYGNAQALIDAGLVIYAPYDTFPAALTASGAAGQRELSVHHPTAVYWPHDPTCMALANNPPCGFSYPYSAILDPNTSAQETVSITGLIGSGSDYVLTTASDLLHSHSKVDLMIPNTQWPIQLNDRMSLLSFMATHAGKNDTACRGGPCPGNPLDIRGYGASSDSHIEFMGMFTAKGAYLSSCPPGSGWWPEHVGARCASTNSSISWAFGRSVSYGTIVDIPSVWDKTTDSTIRPAIRALLGCDLATVAGCRAFASRSSPSSVTKYNAGIAKSGGLRCSWRAAAPTQSRLRTTWPFSRRHTIPRGRITPFTRATRTRVIRLPAWTRGSAF